MVSCDGFRRPLLETVFNTVLLMALILSYLPQYYRIISKRSTAGISPNYVLFNVIVNTAQLSDLLYFYSWRHPVIECSSCVNGNLSAGESYGALLGLIQTSLVSFCSLIFLVLLAIYPSTLASSPKDGLLTSPTRPQQPTLNTYFTVLLGLVQAITIITFTLRLTVPYPSPPNRWDIDTFFEFLKFLLIPISTILAAIHFVPQLRVLLHSRPLSGSSSPLLKAFPRPSTTLSNATLILQAILFLSLAISFTIRTRDLELAKEKEMIMAAKGVTRNWYHFHYWHYGLGWPAWNWVLLGMGQGVLAVVGRRLGRDEDR